MRLEHESQVLLEQMILKNPSLKNRYGNDFLNLMQVCELKKPSLFIRFVKGTGKVIAGFFTTLIGGALSVPYFAARQIFCKQAEPDTKWALYFYKLAAKFYWQIRK